MSLHNMPRSVRPDPPTPEQRLAALEDRVAEIERLNEARRRAVHNMIDDSTRTDEDLRCVLANLLEVLG